MRTTKGDHVVRPAAPLPGDSPVPSSLSPNHTPPRASWERAKDGTTAAIAVLLATVPSWLVVQDRWLEHRAVREPLNELWKKLPGLTGLAYPSYFLIVFSCSAILLLFLALQRQPPPLGSRTLRPVTSSVRRPRIPHAQRLTATVLLAVSASGVLAGLFLAVTRRRIPGWDLAVSIVVLVWATILRDIPVQAMVRFARRNALLLIGIPLAHISMLGLMAHAISEKRLSSVYLVLLLLSLANLLRLRRRVSPIVWIVLFAIPPYMLHIGSWFFSIIGDEYEFWTTARDIATRQDLATIGSHLFRLEGGVYGVNAYFSSVIHAIGLKLGGISNFSWRANSLYLSALAVGFFFLFFKTFVSRRVALFASLFLASSHYIMAFGKIGYNQLQSYFAFSLLLAASAWAARSRRNVAFLLTGLSLGLCFYVYPGALYVIPVAPLLLLLFFPPRNSAAVGRWATLTAGFFVLAFPLLFQPAYWKTKIIGTVYNHCCPN